MHRPRAAVTAAVVVAVAIGVAGVAPASAQCVGPKLSVDRPSGPPGATVTVHGEYYGTDCNDRGRPPPGQGALGVPATGIDVYFTQGDRTSSVTTVDADDAYEFTASVTVPEDALTGAAAFATDARQGPPAGAVFTVAAPTNAETGDSSTDGVLVLLLVIGVFGFGGVMLLHARRKSLPG